MYARTVGRETLTFGVSGMLWRENLVMYDRQSESWWSQADGKAIRGPRQGGQLEQVASAMMSWRDWRSLHPATQVLSPPRGAPGGDRYARYHESRDIGVTGRLRSGGALDAKARILGFQLDGRPYAVSLNALGPSGVAQLDAGGQSVVVVRTADGAGARAFLAGSRRVRASDVPAGPRRLRDDAGHEWDALSGQPVGAGDAPPLEPLTAHVSYWFSWYSFFPHSAVLSPGR